MTAVDEELIDYFIEKLQDGWLSKNEDVPHFICKIREIEKEVKEQAVIINFLKKELQKKTSYRQVMKRQYRELKQKYDSLWGKIRQSEHENNIMHQLREYEED